MRSVVFAKVFGVAAALAFAVVATGSAEDSPNAEKWGTVGTLGGKADNQSTGELYADVMMG